MKRWLALLVVPVLAAVVLIATGGGRHAHYRTLPRPPLPHGLTVPACQRHTLGACLPQAPVANALRVPRAVSSAITGPDLSNNDPVYSSASWDAIRAHSRFVYLKSVEGTGFTDSTARTMAAAAKARHLPVGGYDFQHVCGVSASAEATHFVIALRVQGLLGPGTLPPAADSEYGNGSCGGRVWLQTWVDTVYRLDGHVCPIDYTGAWWWQPNIGAWWPTCQNRELLSWISGYGVSYPFMPASLHHLDFWQFSDHGFNGASYADLSGWRNGESAFRAFASQPPPGPSQATISGWRKARNTGFSSYRANKCTAPQDRAYCRLFGAQVVSYQAKLWSVYPRWPCFGPGARTKSQVCWIVRPQASWFSHARQASQQAFDRHVCGGANGQTALTKPCRIWQQRVRWFNQHATALVNAYS